MTKRSLDRALSLLGPLEGRIMREVWEGGVPPTFVVADMRQRMPELAYTTVMTTLARLANKGLLQSAPIAGQRAYTYRPSESCDEFITRISGEEVAAAIQRLGDGALVAFNRHVSSMTAAQRDRLRKLAQS